MLALVVFIVVDSSFKWNSILRCNITKLKGSFEIDEAMELDI